jgi:hypothetical protein
MPKNVAPGPCSLAALLAVEERIICKFERMIG